MNLHLTNIIWYEVVFQARLPLLLINLSRRALLLALLQHMSIIYHNQTHIPHFNLTKTLGQLKVSKNGCGWWPILNSVCSMLVILALVPI